ncbi:MAG: LLM class F420-dependent oxidoreductase [Anaerolineales bacterium]|nr:LLM class F420-dependent oxidoreductase [Anaerolineales bacterium]
MDIGVVFPQTEFGSNPAAIKDYAQTAEALGYTHILAYDHVLGANPDRPGGWHGPYTYQTPFHEVFTLFSFMAAVTKQIEFVTGILILPQRQTALAAKQAAELAVLSGGRFRMGVGIGWNAVEYTALNEDFSNRGKRVEEQIDVMRKLWSQELVTYEGKWHSIPDAGINPLPKSPIPIWLGGHHDNVLRRVATIGDGWMPNYRTAAEAQPSLEKIKQYATEAGRNPDEIGLHPRVVYGEGDQNALHDIMEDWDALGANHISLNTMGSKFTTAQHIGAMRTFAGIFSLGK